jgi:hypothetical protein
MPANTTGAELRFEDRLVGESGVGEMRQRGPEREAPAEGSS